MICSAFTKKDSPFVWLQFACAAGDKKRYRKTGIRKDDTHRKAKITRAVRDQIQAMRDGSACHAESALHGWDWVPGYTRTRYGANDRTATVYRQQWIPIMEFFALRGIGAPAELERLHAFDYIEWRTGHRKQKSGKFVARNTALMELKFLAQIMDEAVAMNLALTNPVRRLKIKADEPVMKPELTAEDERTIRAALANSPEWMRIAFHVGISTGLRWSNCNIAASAVRMADNDILIERPKGGAKREFAIPIYPSIRPLIDDLLTSRRRTLYQVPPKDAEIIGLVWRRFFDRLGMQSVSFHCTRVTFITRGMRAGIPETVMMRMVNHGSKLVSRIYQRWTADDVRRYAELIPQTAFSPLADQIAPPAAKGRSRARI